VSLPNPDNFGDYIVFADESDDHGLENVSQDYPVFVLFYACSIEGFLGQHENQANCLPGYEFNCFLECEC
jgi:hypothetical protein